MNISDPKWGVSATAVCMLSQPTKLKSMYYRLGNQEAGSLSVVSTCDDTFWVSGYKWVMITTEERVEQLNSVSQT